MADNRFVSEKELEEHKKKRQEEWEKIRSESDPVERPEEAVDTRPLFERLREQQDKKQAEYEESHRLKHIVRGLDDEEIGFLGQVDEIKMREERKRKAEEEEVLKEALVTSAEPSTSKTTEKTADAAGTTTTTASKPKQSPSSSVNSQAKLLAGIVKRKNVSDNTKGSTEGTTTETKHSLDASETVRTANRTPGSKCDARKKVATNPSALVKLGSLPSLSGYGNSEESGSCSSSDEESMDELEMMPQVITKLRPQLLEATKSSS